MKLAEALKEKNKLRKEITVLRERLEQPSPAEETPKELLLKLEDKLRRLKYLSVAIKALSQEFNRPRIISLSKKQQPAALPGH